MISFYFLEIDGWSRSYFFKALSWIMTQHGNRKSFDIKINVRMEMAREARPIFYFRIQKYTRVWMYPPEYRDKFPYNHDYSFLHWFGRRQMLMIFFCKEALMILVVDIWSNYLKFLLGMGEFPVQNLLTKWHISRN